MKESDYVFTGNNKGEYYEYQEVHNVKVFGKFVFMTMDWDHQDNKRIKPESRKESSRIRFSGIILPDNSVLGRWFHPYRDHGAEGGAHFKKYTNNRKMYGTWTGLSHKNEIIYGDWLLEKIS